MAKKWEHQSRDAAVPYSVKHEKGKSFNNSDQSRLVRTNVWAADVKRQKRSRKRLDRSKRSPARPSGGADRDKWRPANRR
jgi:hypothetical protein